MQTWMATLCPTHGHSSMNVPLSSAYTGLLCLCDGLSCAGEQSCLHLWAVRTAASYWFLRAYYIVVDVLLRALW